MGRWAGGGIKAGARRADMQGMWPWSRRATEASENEPARGRAERLETAVLTCALGPVVDVSRSGMSVQAQRVTGLRVGAETTLELCAPAESMEVRVRVVRVRPIGGGRYELAMEFLGVSEDERVMVENMARYGKRKGPAVFVSGARREKIIEALRLPDYYQVLGIQPGATEAEVQRAYRALARTHHPDVCREEGALQRFCLINEAHDTLMDEERRAAYDGVRVWRGAA